MRILTFLTIWIFHLNSFGQTPDYFANNPSWACGYWSSNVWSPPSIYDSFIYYLDGDTVALGFTYHRVFKRGEIYLNSGQFPASTYDVHSGYYVRQVGKSIRFFTLQNNSDSLLVSYNYVVGDTVRGHVFQSCGHNQDTIQKIDSVLVNSEYRKVFYVDSIMGPVITEGVGHQLETNTSIGEFLKELCLGIGWDYSIHCFGFNDTPYWDSNGGSGNCNLNIGILENSNIEFSVSPNPAHETISIVTSTNIELEISIFDLNGKLMLKGNQPEISVESLSAGFYLVVIQDLEGNTGRTQLVVE